MPISRPRGTSDILPGDAVMWQSLESAARELCRLYGYGEIRTPVFEATDLFLRGVGETTDIVEKEMYTFTDKSKEKRRLTLRPEGTAPVARAYLENSLHALPQPVKLYYIGPMFRYDRPQAGRYRQFHQFGVEIFGAEEPGADAEVIALATAFLDRLGLSGLQLHLNSVGCPTCRAALRQRLVDYFQPRIGDCCPDCRGRLDKNPLRILDCKEPGCREAGQAAPTPLDCLCADCGGHFDRVRHDLEVLKIDYHLNPRLVRGLDYYTKTAFEILMPTVGAQDAVGGGGRYDGLVEVIGGKRVPGVGFALGLERTLLLLKKQAGAEQPAPALDAFVVTAGETRDTATKLVAALRAAGLAADRDYTGRSLKAQMKYAGKLGVRQVIIAGEEELRRGQVVLRHMENGEQTEVFLTDVVDLIKQKRS